MADTTLKLTFGYEDNSTRQYSLAVADSLSGSCKSKIKNLNVSLLGGTSDGLDTFFLSDNGQSFTGITAAQLESTEIITLDLEGSD